MHVVTRRSQFSVSFDADPRRHKPVHRMLSQIVHLLGEQRVSTVIGSRITTILLSVSDQGIMLDTHRFK